MKPTVNNLQSISSPKSDFKILKSFFAALKMSLLITWMYWVKTPIIPFYLIPYMDWYIV